MKFLNFYLITSLSTYSLNTRVIDLGATYNIVFLSYTDGAKITYLLSTIYN